MGVLIFQSSLKTLALVKARDIKGPSDKDVRQLFEDLFLHYRKDYINEEEMLKFLKDRGIMIRDTRELAFLMYHAERVMKWVVAGKDGNWKPALFAKSPQDLEEFLEKYDVRLERS